MSRIFMFLVVGAALIGAPVAWAAEEWGLPREKTARFEAKVVDMLCELSGDCPNG